MSPPPLHSPQLATGDHCLIDNIIHTSATLSAASELLNSQLLCLYQAQCNDLILLRSIEIQGHD